VANLEDLPADIQPKVVRANGLREQNALFGQELESMGAGFEVASARVEHALVFLVDIGVITESQRWDEAIAWEMALRGQLQYMIEQVKKIRSDAEEARAAEERRRMLLRP
jgi:hypothetical protein